MLIKNDLDILNPYIDIVQMLDILIMNYASFNFRVCW